ncbi:30S ribosomal protein 3, chloroplastic-like isoform X2 [Coffea eugenioides]|uniref:30S ribosomal protein 3, chloroplastic-like isoform X2 n=1 Tax=Coffea eugenioides TaxID=49369 RepID=UPI000F608F8F|nr:30S ribosomal protein 3, chloroplastic-like isoform X2 [Coffea eugenioides]
MYTTTIQPTVSCFSNLKPSSPSSFPSQKLWVSLKIPKPSSLNSCQLNKGRTFSISASSAAVAQDTPTPESISSNLPQKQLKVVVKPMEKPRLVLKFVWMQKNIGISIDQVIPGYGTIPLSPYYFWPRKDAWEELRLLLESKPWISQKQMVILLNQATDIINLWQQSGGDLA